MERLDQLLSKNILSFLYIVFIAAGAEQLIAGKLTYTDFFHNVPLAVATGLVAVGRGLAAYKK